MDVFQEVVKQLAIKHNKKESEVELLYRYQFKYLKDQIQTGNFDTIMLHHLGKFVVSNKNKKYWKENSGQVRTNPRWLEELSIQK